MSCNFSEFPILFPGFSLHAHSKQRFGGKPKPNKIRSQQQWFGSNKRIYLVKSLNNNISLHELNLSNNNLTNDFANALAKTLRENDVLWKVDIGYNPIGMEGANSLILALKENNDTLESMGNIEVNTQMGVNNIQELRKHLKINEYSKDLRRKIIENRKNASFTYKN